MIEIYSDEKFLALQKRIIADVLLTRDNVQQKILELPILYTKYKKLYLEQRQLLKNINIDIKKTKAKRYHFYKFDNDFRLDTATEINLYVEGDDEMCQMYILQDKQEGIVEYIKDALSQIDKMSYQIRSYVDLEKLRNGAM